MTTTLHPDVSRAALVLEAYWRERCAELEAKLASRNAKAKLTLASRERPASAPRPTPPPPVAADGPACWCGRRVKHRGPHWGPRRRQVVFGNEGE